MMVLLCAAYVFGCAFRSILPRADVQRIVLFDTWLSSVFVGRSVATIAEICFVIQWAIVLRQLGKVGEVGHGQERLECDRAADPDSGICSWYAVITTNYLGNAIENSLWAVTFTLIAVALVRLLHEFHGARAAGDRDGGRRRRLLSGLPRHVDVPMYLGRWRADLASGKELLGIFSGLYDLGTRWAVTHDFAHWHEEIAWMSLYFSVAVWSSLALCGFELVKHHLPRYRRGPAALPGAARRQRVPVRVARARLLC